MACRSVVYVRVSTAGQVRNGQGLTIQERDCRVWAKKNGHRVVEVCSDDGISGTIDPDSRPGLFRALNLIRSGEATALLVPSLDRLAREVTTQEAALAKVWDAGGQCYSVDQGEIHEDDPDDPMRTAIRKMRAVMHELDKGLISKRLREGRRAKAAGGGYVGGQVPYGFRVQDGRVGADDDEQRVVQVIGQLSRQGLSLRQIAARLDELGIEPRSGGAWHPTQVNRILSTPAYWPVPAGRPGHNA